VKHHDLHRDEQRRFNDGNALVLSSNAVSAGLSVGSELVSSSAVTKNLLGMELGDMAMVVGLRGTGAMDKAGYHEVAARARQLIFIGHIGLALYGIGLAVESIQEEYEIAPSSIVVSTLVGAISLEAVRRDRQARKQTQPTDLPSLGADVNKKTIQYRMNSEGNVAIAMTNIAEGIAALSVPALQLLNEQGASAAVIGGNAVVISIMGLQVAREQVTLRRQHGVAKAEVA